MSLSKNIAAVVVVFFAVVSSAVGQTSPQPGTVAGRGRVTLQLQARQLRMVVELQARGEDLEEALQNLSERQQSAVEKLKLLRAEESSIRFGNPEISQATSDRQRQIEAILAQQRRAGGRVADRFNIPTAVIVSKSLQADWQIEAETPEEVLLFCHNLTAQIEEADLAGADDEQLSPQEQEIMEEIQDRYGYYEEEVDLREPYFLYVSPISDEERKEALADAFQKARSEAAAVATAAGVELGPLQQLAYSSQFTQLREYYNDYGYGGYGGGGYIQSLMKAVDEDANEAIGMQPTEVSYYVEVEAAFSLQD